MKKRYRVSAPVRGYVHYVVEAGSSSEARAKAEEISQADEWPEVDIDIWNPFNKPIELEDDE